MYKYYSVRQNMANNCIEVDITIMYDYSMVALCKYDTKLKVEINIIRMTTVYG